MKKWVRSNAAPTPLTIEENDMWYFAWILGVLLACAFGIINAMWLESEHCVSGEEDNA